MNHLVIAIFLAVVLAAYGGAAAGGFGFLCGIGFGLLLGLQLRTHDRLRRLELQLEQAPAPDECADERHPPSPAAAQSLGSVALKAVAISAAARDGDDAPRAASVLRRQDHPRAPGIIERALVWLKRYMSTGNVVAKVGVLVLFVGVSFLLKYAVERNALSIELRLAGTALGALALLVGGWRLRARRAAFGLILQGAGVGILYVTIFAAARLYQVLPRGLTLLLLLALVVLFAFLAVVQDSRALATLGTVGGFLAPILTSTGSGNHVALFSYYALLNLGIVGIAWFKAWRILNWVGFMFTFVIGAAWGYRFYTPAHFASTEPFLILSFLFYLAVSVLFAQRHPPRLRGYVDGTLVFGLPLVFLALQAALVRDIAFGRAWSALGMGLVYLAAARWLWNRNIAHMRMLIESLLALGVVALSLAIPFAFDGHITATAWALEGVGLVWIGIRQQRVLARAFGSLLQLAAGAAFLVIHSHGGDDEIMVLNARFLGSLFIALGALLASFLLWDARKTLRAGERALSIVLLAWGVLWWLGAGNHEIGLHIAPRFETAALLLFLSLSAGALAQAAARLDWLPATRVTLLWLPAFALLALSQFHDSAAAGPLAGLRWLGWLCAAGTACLVLRRAEPIHADSVLGVGHALLWWSGLLLVCWGLDWSIGIAMPHAGSWAFAVWGVVPALMLVLILRLEDRVKWPLQRFRTLYIANAQLPVAGAVLVWVLGACLRAGDPYPLDFLPLLNPLDLAQATSLLLVLRWWLAVRDEPRLLLRPLPAFLVPALVGSITFLWLNAATARTVHFFAAVSYTPQALRHSAVFQGSISVLWGLSALALMVAATRSAQRRLWLSGAALLALLVLKLFFIDLAGSGTVARIVSFMAAGGLMVLIGYLSPAPPVAPAEHRP